MIADLVVAVQAEADAGRAADYAAWWRQLDGWRETYPLGYTAPTTARSRRSTSSPRLGEIAGPEAIYVAGVGQHQMWAAQFIRYERPGTWLNSGGLGTMGFAVPAAMGAKVGRPDATVWAIDGDGCFQMTNQELATCAIERHPDQGRGHQQRQPRHGAAVADPVLRRPLLQHRPAHRHSAARIPDFVKLAEAYGCVGLRCEQPEDVDATIEKAMAIDDRPVVVDFVVHRDAMVWPMVPAGTSNDEIQVARGHRAGLGPRRGLRTNCDDPAHPVGAGRGQARRAGARRGAVLPARLQHRVARGRPDRAPRTSRA